MVCRFRGPCAHLGQRGQSSTPALGSPGGGGCLHTPGTAGAGLGTALGSPVGRCYPHSQESGGSDWHLLLGLVVSVHSHLWGLEWPQRRVPAPRTPVGSVLLPNGHRERGSYGSLTPLPMHPLNNGTWYLSSAPASSEYLLCCYHPASSGCLHAANPCPLPGSDL